MDFLADVLVLEVFLHELRHQVAPVGGGVDQQLSEAAAIEPSSTTLSAL